MEESRYVFTEALGRKYNNNNSNNRKDYSDASLSWMDVKLLSMEEQKRTGFGVLHFEKMNTNTNTNTNNSNSYSNTPWSSSTAIQSSSSSLPTPSLRFTPKELSNQRPGCCFEIEIQIELDDNDNDNNDNGIDRKNADDESLSSSSLSSSSSSSSSSSTTTAAIAAAAATQKKNMLGSENENEIKKTKTMVLLGSILPSRGGSGRDNVHTAPKVTLVVYDTEQIYQLQELQEQQEQPMTANDEASSLLDQLMGADRNESPTTKAKSTSSPSSSSQQQQKKKQPTQPLLSFRIRFCTTLISQCRQFEACDDGSSRTHKSGSNNTLLRNIMGQKEATHIRFNYSDDDDDDGDDNNGSSDEEEKEGAIVGYVIDNDDDHHNISNEYYYENVDRNTNNNSNDGFLPCFNDDMIAAANNSNYDSNNSNNNDHKDTRKLLFQQSPSQSIIDTTSFTKLNEIQEKAAMDFCHSKDGSLQLIQGPPGTGKTTFVVSVLARLLMGEGSGSSNGIGGGGSGGNGRRRNNRKRRILVTAPTNKAVSVIAKRFLESCGPTLLEGRRNRNNLDDSNGTVNQGGIPIVLIGVEDKLLENNTNHNNDTMDRMNTKNKKNPPSPVSFVDAQMKRIFCYSWLSSLADDYTELLQAMNNMNTDDNTSSRKSHNSINDTTCTNSNNNRGLCSWLPTVFPSCDDGNENDTNNGSTGSSSTLLHLKAQGLHTRLVRNLPYLSESSGVAKLSRKLLYCLGEQEGGAGDNGADGADDQDREGKEEGELKEEEERQQQQRQQQQPNYSEARMCVRQVIAILKNESISNAVSFDSGGTSNNNGTGTTDESKKHRDEDAVATNNGPDNSFTPPALDGFAVLNELLYSAQIVFCTLSSAATSLMKNTKRFDDWIVDEAAAATEPELFIPLVHLRPRRLLAVGDPMQLPALVASPLAVQWGLGRSLHERLVEDLHRSQTMLTVQYRMKPAISEFPSKRFYEGKLTNGANVQRLDYGLNSSSSSSTFDRDEGNSHSNGRTITSGQEQQLLEATKPWCFFQVNGKECQSSSGSYYNIDEASAVIKFLRMIRKRWLYQQQQQKSNTPLSSWWTSDKVRIITFYSAQVATLKQMLRKETDSDLANVLVSTVDSSQGCEAEIVILSFVRTSGNGGFLNDDRRMNVALTRAKYKLLCLGNIRTISSWRGRRGASSSTNNTTTTTNSSTTTTTGDDGDSNSSSSGTTLKKMIDDAKQRDCISYVWDHKN